MFDEIPHSEKVLKRHQNSDDPCIMAWDHYMECMACGVVSEIISPSCGSLFFFDAFLGATTLRLTWEPVTESGWISSALKWKYRRSNVYFEYIIRIMRFVHLSWN